MANDKPTLSQNAGEAKNLKKDRDQWTRQDLNSVPSTGESGDTTEIDSQNDLKVNSDVSSNRQTARNTDR